MAEAKSHSVCHLWVKEMKASSFTILIMEAWSSVNESFLRPILKKSHANTEEGNCYFYFVKVKLYLGCGELMSPKLIAVVF